MCRTAFFVGCAKMATYAKAAWTDQSTILASTSVAGTKIPTSYVDMNSGGYDVAECEVTCTFGASSVENIDNLWIEVFRRSDGANPEDVASDAHDFPAIAAGVAKRMIFNVEKCSEFRLSAVRQDGSSKTHTVVIKMRQRRWEQVTQ